MNEKMIDEYTDLLSRKLDETLADTLKTAAALGLTMAEAHCATSASVMNNFQTLMDLALRLGYINEEQVQNLFNTAAESVIRDYNHGEKDVNTHSN